MLQKLLEMDPVTVLFHTDKFIFVCFFLKRKRVPKLGYFDWRVPKLSSRVALATSGAGVV